MHARHAGDRDVAVATSGGLAGADVVAAGDVRSAAQRATRNYAKRQMTWFRHQGRPGLVLDTQLSESLLRCSRHFIDRFLLTAST